MTLLVIIFLPKPYRKRQSEATKYFNQRLLDADGRFAKDVEYLLTAQYAVESKQVADDASIILRQTQGRLHQGQALTAGAVKNQQVIQQMIQRDDAYRFLKNVRGSPAYFQKVMYDVLAMIRQLGLPTWFLILSAAAMQWPDVIQTIARQYGTTLTEDVKSMSFEEKSKWLRQNPPQLGVDSDEDVCKFVDQYISCSIPEDADLAHLVTKLQKHRHSATCRSGHCYAKKAIRMLD